MIFKEPLKVTELKKRKPLSEMTRTDARIAIANDVLSQLAVKAIMAKSGVYAVELDADSRAQYGTTAKCQVCALGSMFVCGLSTPDDVNPESQRHYYGDSQRNMHMALSPYFDESELRLIETAFERDEGFMENDDGDSGDYPASWVARAVVFRDGAGRQRDEDALRAIMENIVANGGEFIP